MSGRDESRIGLWWGLAAYGLWGLFVIYFKAVAHVAPMEVLAHRIIWSVLFLGVLMGFRGRWREKLAPAFRPKVLAMLGLSTALIAVNWFTFIWAVGNAQTVQASLGYYINPLVNVMLGFVFLRERHSRLRWLSVAIAFAAVALLIVRQGTVPVVALVLAFSFGLYGLLRKRAAVGSLVGLMVETKLLLPFALGYLAWLATRGEMAFLHVDRSTDALLLSAGVLTATPLLCFANAARRLDYATVGLLQYIAPTIQFAIAVKVFGETLHRAQLMAFGLIWVALAIYSWDALRRRRLAGSRVRPASGPTDQGSAG